MIGKDIVIWHTIAFQERIRHFCIITTNHKGIEKVYVSKVFPCHRFDVEKSHKNSAEKAIRENHFRKKAERFH